MLRQNSFRTNELQETKVEALLCTPVLGLSQPGRKEGMFPSQLALGSLERSATWPSKPGMTLRVCTTLINGGHMSSMSGRWRQCLGRFFKAFPLSDQCCFGLACVQLEPAALYPRVYFLKAFQNPMASVNILSDQTI